MFIIKAIALLLSCLLQVVPLINQSYEALDADIAEQKTRIEQLEADYTNGKIAAVNENDIFDGDLQAALNSGIKFNEMSFTATHNSYQTKSVPALRQIYLNVSELTFGAIPDNTGLFEAETITEQLNAGIRSIELDLEVTVEGDNVNFVCMHAPIVEMNTTCYDFKLALKEILMWSNNNPNHLPITILVEPKLKFVPMENMRFMNIKYLNMFDTVLRNSLGDTLYTPKEMLGDYESFKALREDDGWKEVKDLLGKVMVILHPSDDLTTEYIEQDTTIKSQAMFPMLETEDADKSYAGMLIMNDSATALENTQSYIKEQRFIVRTRSDEFYDVTDEGIQNALNSCAQIITTDFPVKYKAEDALDRLVCFGDGKTVRANITY